MARPASPQAMIIGIALVGWALAGADAWWTLALAYLAGWAIVNARKPSLPRWALGLMLLVPLVVVWQKSATLLDAELLRGIPTHLADRARLEASPTIAPPLVRTDHPQRFWIHAPGSESLRLRLGERGSTLNGTGLGGGLFFVDYDPRAHGTPREGEGPSGARVLTDTGSTSRELQVVRPGPHPRWFCQSPDRLLAVTPSEETDQVYLVDPEGRVRAIDVGDGPTDCAFLDDQRFVVGHRYGPTLWVLDREGHVLRRAPWRTGVHRLAIAPSRNVLAIAEPDGVTLVGSDLDVLARTPLDAPDWLAFSDDETLVVSQRRPTVLHRLRAEWGWTLGAPLPLGRPAVTMRATDGALVVATTDYRADGSAHHGNHFVQDQLLEVDVGGWFVRRQTLTPRRSPRQGSAGNVDRGASPMGIEALDDGALRVAFAGTDEVWRLGVGVPEMLDTPDTPAPHGIVTFATGTWAVTSPSAGTIATRLGDDWRVVELEGGSSTRRRGEHAFYEATRSGVSCQSCHLHGDTDFVMRNIGGRRLAPTLGVGGILGTSPYLRDGSYPRVRDLDHLSQELLRGFLRRAPPRGPDIEAYVYGLARRPPPRRASSSDRARRGLDAFMRAECPTCHALPAFTNLSQHPLGTLFPDLPEHDVDEVLDTPSLLSVSTHGPYLSDGRAETLDAVFREHNDANRHGNTAALDDAAIDDLVYFLEGL